MQQGWALEGMHSRENSAGIALPCSKAVGGGLNEKVFLVNP